MVRALSAPVPLRLRPMEIGDLLDETFRIYRRNFVLFAGISIIVSLPQAALSGYTSFTSLGTFSQLAAQNQPADFGQLETTLVVLLIGILVNIALLPFIYGAVTYATCEAAQGRSVTVSAVVGTVLRKYFPLLGYFGLFIGMFVLFCLIPLWIWIWVRWVAVIPAMYVENLGLGGALSRSWQLVQGRWWRTFLVLLLMTILTYAATAALGAFLGLAQILLGVVAAPTVFLAISGAIQVIVESLVDPVLLIVLVLIYFDLRVRREGLDLFQLAQRVAPPGTAL